MSGDPRTDDDGREPTDKGSEPAESDHPRRATVRTTHAAPAVVAAALAPDNTDEMQTTATDEQVVTTIERATTGGLRSTVDDYVVNCSVAERTAQHADRHRSTQP